MASYNPPNPYVPGAFNPTQFITPSDNITTKYLDENYLRFPFAQGVENFVSINNQGSLNQGGLADFSSNTTPAIFNLPPTITNPILDTATTPLNAVATIGYVLANEQGGGDLLPLDNDWTGVNNFNPNQAYGAVMKTGITLTDNQSTSTATGDSTIVSYTPTSTAGFEIYSLANTNSCAGVIPQLQLQPDGAQSKLSAPATNGIAVLAAQGTGGSIQLNADTGVKLGTQPILTFSTFGNLTGSATGIKSSVNFTASTLTTGNMYFTFGGVSNSAQLQPTNVGGLNILATTFNLATPTGGSTTNTILTPQVNNLDISNPITLPTQTAYNSGTTYLNVASTQAFVQSAIQSQGSGDVTLAGTNPFTGTNTFNVNPPTSTINQISTNTTQFATIKYVNGIVSEPYPANALLPGEYSGGGGAGYTYTNNVTGSITGNYIGVNTIQVYPTTITCFASTAEGGDASETITFNLARAIAPNSLTSNTLSGLSATITSAYDGSMRGCQLIAGFNAVSQVYTLSVFVNSNNYFSGPDNYTISFSGLINYIPVT